MKNLSSKDKHNNMLLNSAFEKKTSTALADPSQSNDAIKAMIDAYRKQGAAAANANSKGGVIGSGRSGVTNLLEENKLYEQAIKDLSKKIAVKNAANGSVKDMSDQALQQEIMK